MAVRFQDVKPGATGGGCIPPVGMGATVTISILSPLVNPNRLARRANSISSNWATDAAWIRMKTSENADARVRQIADRKSVVLGKRVDFGGGRIIKKKKTRIGGEWVAQKLKMSEN